MTTAPDGLVAKTVTTGPGRVSVGSPGPGASNWALAVASMPAPSASATSAVASTLAIAFAFMQHLQVHQGSSRERAIRVSLPAHPNVTLLLPNVKSPDLRLF